MSSWGDSEGFPRHGRGNHGGQGGRRESKAEVHNESEVEAGDVAVTLAWFHTPVKGTL